MKSVTWRHFISCAAGLLITAFGTGAMAELVDFDTFPGPDGQPGTPDDIVVVPGTEITDQYEGFGVMIENALSATGFPGLYAIPQGNPGTTTDDIIPTSPPNAAAPLDIPGDLETSSTGFVRITIFPSADDFCLDLLDVEGSGIPGTGNTFVRVGLESGGSVTLPVPSGPSGSQQSVCYVAPVADPIATLFVSLNDGALGGESSAIDSLRFTRTPGRCWLTTGGHLKGALKGKSVHSFGGNVGPPPSGSWEHIDHSQGLNFHSFDAEIVRCFNDGNAGPGHPKAEDNVAQFRGTGRLNGEFGYDFVATVVDRGEPGKHDRYSIRVFQGGTDFIVVDDKRLSGGNVQIHPPNPSLNN